MPRLTPEQRAIRDLTKEVEKLDTWINGTTKRGLAFNDAVSTRGMKMFDRLVLSSSEAKKLLP